MPGWTIAQEIDGWIYPVLGCWTLEGVVEDDSNRIAGDFRLSFNVFPALQEVRVWDRFPRPVCFHGNLKAHDDDFPVFRGGNDDRGRHSRQDPRGFTLADPGRLPCRIAAEIEGSLKPGATPRWCGSRGAGARPRFLEGRRGLVDRNCLHPHMIGRTR